MRIDPTAGLPRSRRAGDTARYGVRSTVLFVAHHAVMSAIKSAPLAKFFLWRVYNKCLRTVRRNYPARTYFGAWMMCDINDYIQKMIFYLGFWEPTLSALAQSRLKEGNCFVDVGANVGYYSLLGRSCVGPSGCVVSIEASPEIFLLLEANLRLNVADNVRAVNIAVADRVGVVMIHPGPPHNIGQTRTVRCDPGVGAGHTIASAPLSAILTDEERRRVRLIKIDVEGGEAPILADLLHNIDDYPRDLEVLVELSPLTDVDCDKQKRLMQGLFDAGFGAYRFENPYSVPWYLNWRRPSAPERIFDYPTEQSDVLFTRAQDLGSRLVASSRG